MFLFPFLFVWIFFSCSGKKTNSPNDTPTDSVPSSLDILNVKLESDPNNAGLLYERALIYYEKKLLEKGLIDIQKAIKIDSTQSSYFLLMSDLYYATNKISDARNSIEKAIKLDPKNKDANIKMGELQYYLGDYKEAFKYLDDALRIDPFEAKVYFIKGMCFKENGDTNLAISSFRTAVEQDPDYFHAYMQLGNIFAAQNNPIAIDYYNNAINVNPTMVEAHYALGFYLQEHGNPDGALKVYNDLLMFDPNNAPTLHNIGYIYLFYKGDYDAAISWFNKALEADSRIVNGYYHRGYAYELKKDYASAKKDYEQALILSPEFDLAKKQLQKIKNK